MGARKAISYHPLLIYTLTQAVQALTAESRESEARILDAIAGLKDSIATARGPSHAPPADAA